MRLLLLLITLFFVACSPLNNYIRKAGNETTKGNLEKARMYYSKAYRVDTNSYKANTGLGITLSEFMRNYEEALPYLQKAEKLSNKDTLEDLYYALGKSYQYHEQFDKALYNFRKMQRFSSLEDDDKIFHLELNKAIEDCYYAKSHTEMVNPKEYFIANIGSKINTAAPEYGSVLSTNNELLFTSKRKDHKKEKINPVDGKYFESMYLSKIENGRFGEPRRYTLPDMYLKSSFKKGHEAIVSMSPDGKKIFVFRNGKLFETDMAAASTEPVKLSNKINLDYYQNHAYLTKDGKTLYFTSEEGKKGLGENDIYKVTKLENGSWGEPENLGDKINTKLNEESPFISDDEKTLYFASNGHPGYGGYDIYKSSYENGSWTTPVNLGKPINTVGNDLFFINTSDNKYGYFSSNRRGGKGDMDIYKINFNPLKNTKECQNTTSDLITINTIDTDLKSFKQHISFQLNKDLKNKVLDFSWKIGNDTNILKNESIDYDFIKEGNYPITLKVISWCDTCLEPIVTCKQVITSYTIEPKDTLSPALITAVDLNTITGQLNNNQLTSLGFNVTPLYFDFNKFSIRDDAQHILENNIEILKKHPLLKIDIIGNTDAKGSNTYNLNLSKQRAIEVKNYLISHGISKKQIFKIEAKGETQLVNNCTDGICDEAQNQLNRRVEFKISK